MGFFGRVLDKLGPGSPAQLMGDSSETSVVLLGTALARIAANGGNAPQNLLD